MKHEDVKLTKEAGAEIGLSLVVASNVPASMKEICLGRPVLMVSIFRCIWRKKQTTDFKHCQFICMFFFNGLYQILKGETVVLAIFFSFQNILHYGRKQRDHFASVTLAGFFPVGVLFLNT